MDQVEVDNSLVEGTERDSSDGWELSIIGTSDFIEEEVERSPERIVKWEDLQQEMEKELNEGAELMNLPQPQVRILMNEVNWDKTTMLEWTSYGESFKRFQDIGIIINPSREQQPVMSISPTLSDVAVIAEEVKDCQVCQAVANPENEMITTVCGHRFCRHCLEKHITMDLETGNRSQFRCPYEACWMMLVDVEPILRRLTISLQESYLKLCLKDFVSCSKNRRSCPNVNCTRTSYLDVNIYTKHWEISCDCGTNYCFACGKLWHYPLSCQQLKEWTNLFEKIPDWISMAGFRSNKKPCPACSKKLTNGFLYDLVVCSFCDYEFCWFCLQNFGQSSICNCSFESDGKIRSEVVAISKLWKDYNDLKKEFSVKVPKVSQPAARDQTAQTIQKNDCVQEENGIGKDIETVKPNNLDEIFDTIIKSQRLLGHCVAFATFLKHSYKKLEFLKQLYNLEFSLDTLIEQVGSDKYKGNMEEKVIDERDKLAYHLSQGFKDDWWQFTSMLAIKQ